MSDNIHPDCYGKYNATMTKERECKECTEVRACINKKHGVTAPDVIPCQCDELRDLRARLHTESQNRGNAESKYQLICDQIIKERTESQAKIARLKGLLLGLKSDRRTIDKHLPAHTHVEAIFRAHMDAIDAALEAKP